MLRPRCVDVAARRSHRGLHDTLFVGRHFGEVYLDTTMSCRIPAWGPDCHAGSPDRAAGRTGRRCDPHGPAVMLAHHRAALSWFGGWSGISVPTQRRCVDVDACKCDGGGDYCALARRRLCEMKSDAAVALRIHVSGPGLHACAPRATVGERWRDPDGPAVILAHHDATHSTLGCRASTAAEDDDSEDQAYKPGHRWLHHPARVKARDAFSCRQRGHLMLGSLNTRPSAVKLPGAGPTCGCGVAQF